MIPDNPDDFRRLAEDLSFRAIADSVPQMMWSA